MLKKIEKKILLGFLIERDQKNVFQGRTITFIENMDGK